MRIVFLGATKFSEALLNALLEKKFSVEAVFYIPQEFSLKKRGEESPKKYQNSSYGNLISVATKHEVSAFPVAGNEQSLMSYYDVISKIKPDLILVLGWYYLVPKKIRELAPLGAVGIHASLLPKYAGGSPLVWALINGEKETGISLFQIEDGVDNGDILAQEKIDIEEADTIATLYNKVTDAAQSLLIRELQKLGEGKCVRIKQNHRLINPLPIRTEADGAIDWEQESTVIYNFVRAQTKPYPCAFSYLACEKVKFVSVSISENIFVDVLPGTVCQMDDKFFIATKNSSIEPLEIEVNNSLRSFSEFIKERKLVGHSFNSPSAKSVGI